MSHPREHLGVIAGGRFSIKQGVRRLPSIPADQPPSSTDPVEPTGCYSFWFWCPGCDGAHKIDVYPDGNSGSNPGWSFDGNYETPTFSPSLLCRGQRTCHSFVQAGKIQFLNDCQHALAGQTVDLPQIPDWMR
jgi:hypothetical protein